MFLGPVHQPRFTMKVDINGQTFFGEATAKKKAKLMAAEKAVASLIAQGVLDSQFCSAATGQESESAEVCNVISYLDFIFYCYYWRFFFRFL